MSESEIPAVAASTTLPSALVRVRAAALFLGMTEKALRRRIDRGQVPTVHIGASVFLRRSDLLRLVAEGRGLSSTGSR